MVLIERQTPPAAAFPPSAAEPAAGIASTPREEPLKMPAVPFIEAPTRQWAIGPGQCRWILADEDAGAEALMCVAQVVPRRPFCPTHSDLVYIKPASEEQAEADPEAAIEVKDPEEEPKEEQEAK